MGVSPSTWLSQIAYSQPSLDAVVTFEPLARDYQGIEILFFFFFF